MSEIRDTLTVYIEDSRDDYYIEDKIGLWFRVKRVNGKLKVFDADRPSKAFLEEVANFSEEEKEELERAVRNTSAMLEFGEVVLPSDEDVAHQRDLDARDRAKSTAPEGYILFRDAINNFMLGNIRKLPKRSEYEVKVLPRNNQHFYIKALIDYAKQNPDIRTVHQGFYWFIHQDDAVRLTFSANPKNMGEIVVQ